MKGHGLKNFLVHFSEHTNQCSELNPNYVEPQKWTQPLETGLNLWKLDSTFGNWTQPLETGPNLWKLDSTFGK